MGCLCYFALFVTIYFTVQVVHSSISDSKLFPNFLCVHMFHGNTFLSRHVIFLCILVEKLLYFSPNIPSVNHFRSREKLSPIGAQDSLVITKLILF